MSQTKWVGMNTVHEYLVSALDSVIQAAVWGETYHFCNPGLRFAAQHVFRHDQGKQR